VTPRRLDDAGLEGSSVVANNAMNRERQLAGVNSYARELGFNPVDFLLDRPSARGWLDLCCGTGRALNQARASLPAGVALVGVDLVDYFDPAAVGVELVCASVASWSPGQAFDLVTCVHGLHYVGDKLGLLARAASWLTDDGLLVADLDLANLALPLAALPVLRRAGFSYDARRRRVSLRGRRDVSWPYRYVGADDRAGPNYTGQPAVCSHYV